jgi:hypothetical protein
MLGKLQKTLSLVRLTFFLTPYSRRLDWYFEHAMRKTQLAGRLARQSGVTKAEAADRLDRVVHQIVTNLRKGRVAMLPGLGQFLPSKAPGEKWVFEFKSEVSSDDSERQGGGDARR